MSAATIEGHRPDELLITGGRLLTPSGMKKADVLIRGTRIAAIADEITNTAGRVLDASGKVLTPGFCNAHTHTHNVLVRGLFDVGCVEMLINVQIPAAWQRTPEETYAAAAWNALENLKSGNTSVCDQFVTLPTPSLEHLEAAVRAYGDVGLRASISPLLSDRPFHEAVPGLLESLPDDLRAELAARIPTQAQLATVEEAVKRWHGSSDGLVSVGVAPSIPLLCSDGLLRECAQLAESKRLNIYVHTAESYVQSIVGAQRYGESIVAHLRRVGCLTDRSVLAHSVWLSDGDLDLIAEAHSIVVHVPGSNARLGSGIARIRAMLARRLNIALGTDGAACSDHQSMFEAMRMTAVMSRVRTVEQAEWLSAPEAFALATCLSARVLGGEEGIGAIEVGQKADLTLLNGSAPCLHPENDPVAQVVLAGSSSMVDSVLVNGRIVLQGGRSTLVDEDQLQEAVDRAGAALRVRNQEEWDTTRSLAPYIASSCMRLSPQWSPAWPDYLE